ncbi:MULTISPECIES: hypothetical protein [unclassified Escherichia]|uniref:hypothetical protein n=1 Tax=unclassified Escherichia TaxID=2608889 RepID=UPI00102A8229|nr:MULTISPECIES: hypothetical protein [unclassified Escherichia]
MFKLELSEGELTLYESCLYFVLEHCPEEELYETIGCESKQELANFQQTLLQLLVKYVDKRSLPKRFFKIECSEYKDYE